MRLVRSMNINLFFADLASDLNSVLTLLCDEVLTHKRLLMRPVEINCSLVVVNQTEIVSTLMLLL